MDDRASSDSPAPGGLLVLRLIWAALLMGQVAFLFVVLVLLSIDAAPVDAELGALLFYVAIGLLMVAVPAAYLIRSVVQQAGRRAGRPLEAHRTGTIAFLAICESAGLFGIVVVLLSGSLWPEILVPLLAMAVQVVSFPTSVRTQKSEAATRTAE